GETILQNILVLAAGQLFTRPDEKSVQSRTVTLAVTPEQVDVLVAAKAKGPLSLSLRGVNDHDIVERPKPKPVEDEAEKARRAKLEKEREEEKNQRVKLEKELNELKEAGLPPNNWSSLNGNRTTGREPGSDPCENDPD